MTRDKLKTIADQLDQAAERFMNAAARGSAEHKALAEYISTLAQTARTVSNTMATRAGEASVYKCRNDELRCAAT